MAARMLILGFCLGLLPIEAGAEDRIVRLHAAPALAETGLLSYILPRFSLKTQVRVEQVADPAGADIVLGTEGRALFEGAGRVWHMDVVTPGDADAERLADWLRSDVGRRTVLGYAPEGTALFAPPPERAVAVVAVEMTGDAVLGHDVARQKCTRCHAVDDESRMSGIGSTPSFAVLRSLADWQARFAAFYALKPHGAFMIVEGLDPLFPADRPPPIAPVEVTLDEVEALIAYVAALPAADLGAPLVHQ